MEAPGYVVTEARNLPENAFTAKRRMPGSIWWGVNAHDSIVLGSYMMERAGFGEFAGLVQAEGKVRGAVSVFKREDVKLATDLHDHWFPILLKVLRPMFRLKALAIETGSRLGHPYYAIKPDKVDILKDKVFPPFLRGDFSLVDNAVNCLNLRMQNNDPLSKVRQVPGIVDGVMRNITVDESVRKFTYKGLDVFAGRSRYIFFGSVLNNWKQAADNMIHDAILQYDLCHHDIGSEAYDTAEYDGMYTLATDVKHFDWHMGAIVRERAKHIGTGYKQAQDMLSDAPYLCAGADFEGQYLVQPDREAGYEVQLASGDSCVASVAKELMIAIFSQFALEEGFASSEVEAIAWTLRGGSRDTVRLKNYGDDNFAYARNPDVLDRLFEFTGRYLSVEKEEPQAFLGWEFVLGTDRSRKLQDGTRQVWASRTRSYFANFYLPERSPGPPFRPFFWEGKFARRDHFRKFGDAGAEAALALEQEVLDEFTLTDARAAMNVEIDRQHMKTGLPLNYVLGKEYLLTDDEKAQLGRTKQIPADTIKLVLERLVQPELQPHAA